MNCLKVFYDSFLVSFLNSTIERPVIKNTNLLIGPLLNLRSNILIDHLVHAKILN